MHDIQPGVNIFFIMANHPEYLKSYNSLQDTQSYPFFLTIAYNRGNVTRMF